MALHRLSKEMPLKRPGSRPAYEKWNEFNGLMHHTHTPKHDANVLQFYEEMALVANLHLLLLYWL